MTIEDRRRVWETYVSMWDPASEQAPAQGVLSPACVYTDPLIRVTGLDGLAGGPFRPGWDDETRQAYLTSTLRLTVIGNEVLAGKEDYAAHARIDRWIGGTHLTNATLWRWDAQAGALIAPSSA